MFYAVKTSHAWAMRALLMLTANIQDVPTGRARGIYPVMIDVPMASSKHTVSKESAGITTCVTTDMSMIQLVHIHHQPVLLEPTAVQLVFANPVPLDAFHKDV